MIQCFFSSYMSVKYEDFVLDPESTVESIYNFMGLQFSSWQAAMVRRKLQ